MDTKRKRITQETKEFVNLLLSYTYFLNESSTKYFSVGFNAETLLPNLIIRAHRKEIVLSTLDWMKFYIGLQENDVNEIKNKSLNVKKIAENDIVFQYQKENSSIYCR
jgi:hypothetical protein